MATGTSTRALLVLGMHRSGTSCLAGMLSAAGLVASGPAVRNWDNARGHFESLALVRLNEAVLAASGGHWLAAPAEVRWSAAQAAERERLLARPIEDRAPLLKDPRSLLTLPFWRASSVPFLALGIVRHPLAVARSLAAWRGIPLAEGIALWTAHNRALLADHRAHGTPLIDFERPRDAVVAAVAAAVRLHGLECDERRLEQAYEERLVHHDAHGAPSVPGLPEAEALFAALTGRADARSSTTRRARHPSADMERFERALAAKDLPSALDAARSACERSTDAAAVAVPVVAALLRLQEPGAAQDFLVGAAPRLEEALAELLRGKVLLARGDAPGAVRALRRACTAPDPYYQARRLLPHALRQAGRRAEASQALAALAPDTLYPQGPLALLAEWAWSDGDREAALARMTTAIEAAPLHRRGRMRTRLAEWLVVVGEPARARAQLVRALEEDPSYPRARRELDRLHSS